MTWCSSVRGCGSLQLSQEQAMGLSLCPRTYTCSQLLGGRVVYRQGHAGLWLFSPDMACWCNHEELLLGAWLGGAGWSWCWFCSCPFGAHSPIPWSQPFPPAHLLVSPLSPPVESLFQSQRKVLGFACYPSLLPMTMNSIPWAFRAYIFEMHKTFSTKNFRKIM